MLNVIALRPVQKSQPEEKPARPPPNLRHHILVEEEKKNSGRLDCGEDLDVEVPQLDIYAAR